MSTSKILIVEDEGLTAMELQQKLKFWGYEVPSFAFSKKEAVIKAKKMQPDLILMDIVLKGEGDGIDATLEINNFLNIPIIYLSAYNDKETMKRVQITEPSDYILKPYKDSELHESIERALNGQKVAKKLVETGEYLSKKLEDAGGAVIISDKEGFVVFMNPAAKNMTGQRMDKARDLTEIFKIRIGNSLVDIKYPNDTEAVSDTPNESYIKPVNDIINEGIVKGVTEEVYLQTAEGNEIPIEYYAYPVRNDNGNFLGAALVFNDISKDLDAGKSIVESEKKFKTIYSESPIPIAIYNENGTVEDANQRALQIFGVEDVAGLDFNLFTDFQLSSRDKEVLMEGKTVKYEFDFKGREEFKTIPNPELCLEIIINPQSYPDNNSVDFYQVQFHDISKYKNLESELKGNVKLLTKENIEVKEDFALTRNNLEAELTDIKNKEAVLNDLRQELEDKMSKTSQELSKAKEDLRNSIENYDIKVESFNQTIEKLKGELAQAMSISNETVSKLEGELVRAKSESDERVSKLEGELVRAKSESDETVSKLQSEVDARMVIEDSLHKEYESLKSEFDDVTTELSNTKRDMESMVNKHVETENSLIKIKDNLQNQLEIKNSNFERLKEDLEAEISTRDKIEKHYQSSQKDLENQLEEKQAEYTESIKNRDSEIAELKMENVETNVLLIEKEDMIKDLTDRTKKDMQRISSLTSLQSNYIRNQMVDMFRDSQKHIKSMAMVHEKIYQSSDHDQINFSQYLNSLVEDIFRYNSTDHNRISMDIQVENVFLDINTATSCGLIINELVSNSLKHAFPNGKEGQIGIELKKNEEYIDMTVTDDGVGLPETFNFKNIETLGLQIVKTLVCEIEGKIEIDTDNGTRFNVQFQ